MPGAGILMGVLDKRLFLIPPYTARCILSLIKLRYGSLMTYLPQEGSLKEKVDVSKGTIMSIA